MPASSLWTRDMRNWSWAEEAGTMTWPSLSQTRWAAPLAADPPVTTQVSSAREPISAVSWPAGCMLTISGETTCVKAFVKIKRNASRLTLMLSFKVDRKARPVVLYNWYCKQNRSWCTCNTRKFSTAKLYSSSSVSHTS